MLVYGGRRGWPRLVGLAAALGILASLGLACGSRTSMLDAGEGSNVGVAGGGAGTAGTSSNANGSPGRAGSGSMPGGGGAKPSKPSNAVASCQRSGGGGGTSCVESFSCNDGSYVTFCTSSPDSAFLDCSCVLPSGQTVSGVFAPAGDICLDATVLCQ